MKKHLKPEIRKRAAELFCISEDEVRKAEEASSNFLFLGWNEEEKAFGGFYSIALPHEGKLQDVLFPLSDFEDEDEECARI